MTLEEHIEEIVLRTKLGQTQESWFAQSNVQNDPGKQLMLLITSAGTQAIAAWALTGESVASDAQYLAAWVMLHKRVLERLAPCYWPLAQQVHKKGIFKRPAFKSEDEFASYFSAFMSKLWQGYNSWQNQGLPFRDSVGCAVTELWSELRTFGAHDSDAFRRAIIIPVSLSDDYIAMFRK